MSFRLFCAVASVTTFATTVAYFSANAIVPNVSHPSWVECEFLALLVVFGLIGGASWIYEAMKPKVEKQ